MNWMQKISSRLDRDDLLFHGSGETINDLKPASHGGILWTAEHPNVAQNYIPISGIIHYFSFLSSSSDYTFRPNKGFNISLLRQMGYVVDESKIEWDHMGQAKSWTGKFPKNQEVQNYIEQTLGYKKNDYGSYPLRIKSNNEVMPADYKLQGTLFVLSGKKKLKILDLTQEFNDLQEPTYNRFDLFEKAEQAGYDAIKIEDYAQSGNLGNFGHESIGVFESGMNKLTVHKVPAKNWDWAEDKVPGYEDTEEFTNWFNSHSG